MLLISDIEHPKIIGVSKFDLALICLQSCKNEDSVFNVLEKFEPFLFPHEYDSLCTRASLVLQQFITDTI